MQEKNNIPVHCKNCSAVVLVLTGKQQEEEFNIKCQNCLTLQRVRVWIKHTFIVDSTIIQFGKTYPQSAVDKKQKKIDY